LNQLKTHCKKFAFKYKLRFHYGPTSFEIKKIKNDLYEQGAIYASLSGSGSSVFGIFSKETNIQYTQNDKYFHKIIDFN